MSHGAMAQRFDANTYPLGPGLRLLEASAGTGKTFALAHLSLRLITEAGLPLDALLVVTYTEAAADELRSRIGQRLQAGLEGLEAQQGDRPHQPPDDVLGAWLSQTAQTQQRQLWISRLLVALEQLDRADITTIHGFCSRSLRRLALGQAAAMDPTLEVDSSDLLREVVQDFWRQEVLTLAPEQLIGLRRGGFSSDQLLRTLGTMDGDPCPHLVVDPTDFDPEQSLQPQLALDLSRSWTAFVPLWKRDGQALEACFRSSAGQWKAAGCPDTKPYSARPRNDRCALVDQWIEAQEGDPSLTARVEIASPLMDYFHPGPWCAAARRCGEAEPSLAAPELQRAITALLDGPLERIWRYALRWGLRELACRRRRRGAVTFAGLLAAMDPGDAEAPWLAPLRQRYRTVLVDEFQDTDPVQWRLLRRGFADSPEHLLLLVGDPKQAIYRFRGGDLATYLSARSRVDRIDVLEDNFRTTASLMEGLNRLMEPGLVRSGLPVPEVRACGKAEAPVGDKPLRVLVHPSPAALTKTNLAEELPQRVAQVVLELLLNRRDLEPSQLCLLVGQHRQASELRHALAARGVPTRLIAHGDVLESDAALQLQRLLDALADPGNSRRLRLLACSPLLGLAPDDLESEEVIERLTVRVRTLATALPSIGLLGCLSALLEGQRMAELSDRGRMLGDLQQAARLVQEAMHQQGLDAASAAQWLRRERLHPPELVPEARQPHSDLAESAVAVVTMHRSKGLEYPVVICPTLWEAPRQPTGPLWQDPAAAGWQLALDSRWGPGHTLFAAAQTAAVAEAERLAYVAVTRAKSQLLLVWARAKNQEDSPLVPWLFGAEAVGVQVDQLDDQRLADYLEGHGLGAVVELLPAVDPHVPRWRAPEPTDALRLAAVPAQLDRSWGRSSYSAWISGAAEESVSGQPSPKDSAMDAPQLEQGRDRDPDGEVASDAMVETTWPDQGCLSDFPRGASAGDCLHRILEQVCFQHPKDSAPQIAAELRRAGIDPSFESALLQGLDRVLQTPLGGALGTLQLADLRPEQRLHELSFDLPVQHIRTADLVRAFQADSTARFGGDYIHRLAGLTVNSRGVLTGSIDLVFCDPATQRWWVLDWKSNWIGERSADGAEADRCGPRHYSDAAMQEQMEHHHYPLQALLYLVALHRHLCWRLPGYAPECHLGGYVYAFLRGMPGGLHPELVPGPGRIVEPAPLKRVLLLDQLLGQAV